MGKKVGGENSRQKAAVDAQSPIPGLRDLPGILGVIIPIVENMVKTGADNRRNDNYGNKIILKLGGEKASVFLEIGNADKEGEADNKTVN